VGGLSVIVPTLVDAVAGIIAGALLVLIVTFAGKAWKAARA
jgi:predicted DNA repair protein MutK